MSTWAELERQAPELADSGRAALYRSGAGEGMLTTVRGEELPRTHPVNVGIVNGRLLVFVQQRSAKTRDLIDDGRYALHAMQDPAEPHEFLVRGRARLVNDPALRSDALAVWPFSPGDGYPLFELDVAHVLYRARANPHDWSSRYDSWTSG
jgi:hypothetical protein